MSKKSNAGGWFSLAGLFGGGKASRAAEKSRELEIEQAKGITQADTWLYGAGSTTVATLLTSGHRQARQRQAIYDKLAEMESDALVSSALSLLVTAALGGHETSGDLVFIEKSPEAQADKQMGKQVEEINKAVGKMLNRCARQSAYTGCAFGDAYARVYADSRGVVDLYTDELVRPPLVQPFERGSKTVGYALFLGERNFERLTVGQMARLKMPRQGWVPQYGVMEKALKLMLTEDNIDNLPVMPSMVGGSFLNAVEDAYKDFRGALLGLVSQRLLDSLDERMVGVNMESMTKDQQKLFLESLTAMFKASKQRMEVAVANDMPIMEVVWNLLPVWGEKQLTQITSPNAGQSGRAGSMGIEDVMFHAKRLTGGLGIDITLLGFADLMSGGLGDGGFFRTSAQAAERARVIRLALADFFHQIIDIHTLNRYGIVYPEEARPWQINFYGSISALENEKQHTRTEAMNSGALLVQAMQQFKDLGATREMFEAFLSKTMLLDEDLAKLYACIADIKPPEQPDGGGGFGG